MVPAIDTARFKFIPSIKVKTSDLRNEFWNEFPYVMSSRTERNPSFGPQITLLSTRRKTQKIKKFGGTPPHLESNHPVEVSCLSRGNVPSVPRTFCPICVELITHDQVGMSQVSRDSPPNRPRDSSEAYRPPNSQGQILAVGILAATLPNSDLNFCWWIFGWIFSSCFSKEKGPKNPPNKSPAKFTRDFVQKNSPRISVEAFS